MDHYQQQNKKQEQQQKQPSAAAVEQKHYEKQSRQVFYVPNHKYSPQYIQFQPTVASTASTATKQQHNSGSANKTMVHSHSSVVTLQPSSKVSSNSSSSDYMSPTVNEELGRESSLFTCPYCQNEIVTAVTLHRGTCVWLSSIVLFFCGCTLCSWIPCFVDTCKDTAHCCPKCGQFLGVYDRLCMKTSL